MAKKVLIVEDDQAISQMYRIKFEAEGYTVDTAENGKLGLELCEQMRPDIVLLDLMMPVMNGDEMLQLLRKTAWGKDVRVVVLTNVAETVNNRLTDKLNATDVLVKADFTPSQLVNKVNKLLK